MALSVMTGRQSIQAAIPSNQRDNNAPAVETLAAYVREQLPNDLGQIHALLQLIDAFAWKLSANKNISRGDISQLSGAIGGVLKVSDTALNRCSDMQSFTAKSLNEMQRQLKTNQEKTEAICDLIMVKLSAFRSGGMMQ